MNADMYTPRDAKDADRRIRRSWLAVAASGALWLGLCAAGLALRVRWLAAGAGVVLFLSVAFIALYYLAPNMRYRRFLEDIERGLITEASGTVAAIDDEPQGQDGARVLPVRLRVGEGPQDERIFYLNADARARFPAVGQAVRLRLCGRHILAATWEEETQ